MSSPGRFAPGSSSRSRPSSYTSQVRMHEKTHSPSGRYHPDPLRRREIRSADITCNIDYYAPRGTIAVITASSVLYGGSGVGRLRQKAR